MKYIDLYDNYVNLNCPLFVNLNNVCVISTNDDTYLKRYYIKKGIIFTIYIEYLNGEHICLNYNDRIDYLNTLNRLTKIMNLDFEMES